MTTFDAVLVALNVVGAVVLARKGRPIEAIVLAGIGVTAILLF